MSDELRSGDPVVVIGLGHYGRSVGAALVRRGMTVVGVEDRPTPQIEGFVAATGVSLLAAPGEQALTQILGDCAAVFPSPGIPWSHPAFAIVAEHGTRVLSEFDLARWWDDRPVVAITGTDGKTSVTELTVDMLRASGTAAMAVGNNELPMIDAIDDPHIDVMVVEASSFRLAHTERFVPCAAAWLNFGPDHLDVHRSLDEYEAAKARIWADLPDDGVAVAARDDPIVWARIPSDRRVVSIGLDEGDGRRVGDELVVGDTVIATVDDLPRAFDHDIVNALFAATLALEGGATVDGIRTGIQNHRLLPHRLQSVGAIDGVEFVNDSKATVPHAVIAALGAYDSIVLIAGGRNKGLDLAPLAGSVDHVRHVVAIGEATPEVIAAFAGKRPVTPAENMDQAVRVAWKAATPGDVVLLSPGCASYDSYASYVARGDDFVRAVVELKEEVGP